MEVVIDNPAQHKKAILQQYNYQPEIYDPTHDRTYQQLLFVLDSKCRNNKCDRNVARELFNQSRTPQNNSSIQKMIEKYVENLETTRLCVQRQQIKLQNLRARQQQLSLQTRNTVTVPYVFMTIYHATIHSHFSQVPIFSYKIEPSSIPQTIIVNELHPVINDSYTVEIPSDRFQLVFYESGVPIHRWTFSGSDKRSGEEYSFDVQGEGVQVGLKVKYFNQAQGLGLESRDLMRQIEEAQARKANSSNAYHKLRVFEPFYLGPVPNETSVAKRVEPSGALFRLTSWLISILPCLGKHVRNYYYSCIVLSLFEMLASLYIALPVLNLIPIFFVIGLIHSKDSRDIGLKLWVVFLCSTLIVVNNIFGAFLDLHPLPPLQFRPLLILDIVTEIITLLLLWISVIRKVEYDDQVEELLSRKTYLPAPQSP